MLNNIIEIGGLAATAINIIQSQRIHEDETSHAQKRHDETMNVAKIQHEKDLKIAKQTYLMAAFTSLEQHFQVNFVLSLCLLAQRCFVQSPSRSNRRLFGFLALLAT